MKPPPSLLLPEVYVVAKKTAPSGGKPRASVCNQSREGLIRNVPCVLCGLVTTERPLLPGPVPEIPPCTGFLGQIPRFPRHQDQPFIIPSQPLWAPLPLPTHTHHYFWSVLPSSHCTRCSLNKCWMSEQTVATWALPPGDENDRQEVHDPWHGKKQIIKWCGERTILF